MVLKSGVRCPVGGRIAAALHGVEGLGLGRLLGSEAVADDHAAACRSETDHFRESHGGLLEVVEGEAAGNNVERSVGERCLIDVAGTPFDVVDALPPGEAARLFEHGQG
jgi:hypothetical protein